LVDGDGGWDVGRMDGWEMGMVVGGVGEEKRVSETSAGDGAQAAAIYGAGEGAAGE
jgi:hypothetical protein